MTAYAQSADCLRARILRYFGDAAPARCENCSVCRGQKSVAPRKRKKKRASGPSCPACGGEMKRRVNASSEPFWGCATYPKCKGTVNIDEDGSSAREL
jgi:predicted nucleic acid-binding Zn ribbon protein